MPYEYQIDPEQELVLTRRWGIVDDRELVALYDELQADPEFGPGLDQLADFTGIDRLEVGNETIRRLARRVVFGPMRRRAFVAARDAHYGLMRVFAAYAGMEGQEVEVFRDRRAAALWLRSAPRGPTPVEAGGGPLPHP